MKKKTLNRALAFLLMSLAVSWSLSAGEVKTKDRPKKCGGYHDGSYHFKCEGEKKNLVDRDQNMKNPFKGFTKSRGKPKKQGQMPHSQ